MQPFMASDTDECVSGEVDKNDRGIG